MAHLLELLLILFLQSVILVQSQDTTPIQFVFPTAGTLAANGSSATGRCSDVTLNSNATSTCFFPETSVLFDGNIPTLTGLDVNSLWASQFFILRDLGLNTFSLSIQLARSYTQGRVEVTIFNCPEWENGVQSISIVRPLFQNSSVAFPTVLSCDSLLTVCLTLEEEENLRQDELLEFNSFDIFFGTYSGSRRVQIAEIAFFPDVSPCPLFNTIPGVEALQNFTEPTAIETLQMHVQSLLGIQVVAMTLLVVVIVEFTVFLVVLCCRRRDTSV